MSVIEQLIAAGQDPLEAVFTKQTTLEATIIVTPYLEQPKPANPTAELDKQIAKAFKTWTPAMKARLRELIEARRASNGGAGGL